MKYIAKAAIKKNGMVDSQHMVFIESLMTHQ